MKMKLTGGLLGVVSLLAAGLANAATVQIDPANLSVANGATFSLTVQGVGFPTTNGGGFRLSWNTADLTLTTDNATIDSRLGGNGFNFNSVNSATAGQLDVIAGIFFAPSKSGNFNIVTLDFLANQPGITVTDIGVNPLQTAWVDGSDVANIFPTYVGATITVTSNATGVVPVPAAVWLFGSGLLGMVGVARRRGSQAA